MSPYAWILALSCPLPAVIAFLYALRHVLPPTTKIGCAISLYTVTVLTEFLTMIMQLVHSEVSVVVVGVIASTVYAFYLGYSLKGRALLGYQRASTG